jgi:glycosyltransferase involved in cell wall biosynthesis
MTPSGVERPLDLLCVAARAPLTLADGDTIRVHGLLRALAEHHRVRFLGVGDATAHPAGADALRTLCDGRVDVVPAPAPSGAPRARVERWARALSSRTPIASSTHRAPAVAARLAELAPRCDGVVLLDNAVTVYEDALRRARRRVVDVHQVAGWPLTHGARPPLRHPAARARRILDGALMRAYEARTLGDADAIVVTSDEEAHRLRELYGLDAAAVVPSAVDLPSAPLRTAGSGVVAWIGGLGYGPNRTGLVRFVEEAWGPLGRAGYRLRIGGAGTTPEVQALTRHPGVEVLGFVDDLPAFLAEADAAVVPLWAGSGVKLKSVTFLAAGLPLVSTSVGVEGMGVVDGRDALVRDDPEALADGLRAVLGDPDLAGRLGAAGRDLVARELSWPVMGARFREVVERAVPAAVSRPAAAAGR